MTDFFILYTNLSHISLMSGIKSSTHCTEEKQILIHFWCIFSAEAFHIRGRNRVLKIHNLSNTHPVTDNK